MIQVHRKQVTYLQRLQREVVKGERARIARDDLILRLHEEAEVSQVRIAEWLDAATDEHVSRNSVQKVIQRQRRENGNGS